MADLYSAFVLLLLPLCHLLSTDGWDGSVRWVCCLLPAHPPACGIPSVKVQMDHKYGGRERPGKRNNKLTRWTDDSSGMYAGRTHTHNFHFCLRRTLTVSLFCFTTVSHNTVKEQWTHKHRDVCYDKVKINLGDFIMEAAALSGTLSVFLAIERMDMLYKLLRVLLPTFYSVCMSLNLCLVSID